MASGRLPVTFTALLLLATVKAHFDVTAENFSHSLVKAAWHQTKNEPEDASWVKHSCSVMVPCDGCWNKSKPPPEEAPPHLFSRGTQSRRGGKRLSCNLDALFSAPFPDTQKTWDGSDLRARGKRFGAGGSLFFFLQEEEEEEEEERERERERERLASEPASRETRRERQSDADAHDALFSMFEVAHALVRSRKLMSSQWQVRQARCLRAARQASLVSCL